MCAITITIRRAMAMARAFATGRWRALSREYLIDSKVFYTLENMPNPKIKTTSNRVITSPRPDCGGYGYGHLFMQFDYT